MIFKHRGWVRIIIGYVLICFWSWCCSLNSKAWVSVCGSSRVTNGISLPFPFMTFIQKGFFLLLWVPIEFISLALDFLAMAAQHSDILHQLFTVTDDVNQFPEWFAVRKVFFVQKCTPFYLRWSRFLSLSQKFFILIIIITKNAFGAENYLIYAWVKKKHAEYNYSLWKSI